MTVTRPNWDSYFIGLAFLISARSKDAQTKHGTIIVDNNNIILGTGYNSFIKGINDASLPAIRPNKYPFMIHSELNAILNCRVLPREAGGGTAYVTGKCCNHCLQSLIQAGLTKIVMANRKGTELENDESLNVYVKIIELSGIKIETIDFDFTWMKEIIEYQDKTK